MVSPTIESIMLGYWIYIKKHPEMLGVKFESFTKFVESGVSSINTCVGLDGCMFCDTLEEAIIMCSYKYGPQVFMHAWNLTNDNFHILDNIFESLFRGRMYEYEEIAYGKKKNINLTASTDQYKEVYKYMKTINDDVLHYSEISNVEYVTHCEFYKSNIEIIEDMEKQINNMMMETKEVFI